ncbi:hypothetical protein A0U40_10125 [[Bacillus] sp. KCTC 13219]|nr:hypothetical protein A0U40_10125 [[Bacillus] sp. KCTC 13219]
MGVSGGKRDKYIIINFIKIPFTLKKHISILYSLSEVVIVKKTTKYSLIIALLLVTILMPNHTNAFTDGEENGAVQKAVHSRHFGQ